MIDHQNWKLEIGDTSITGLQPWCETDTPNFQPSFYWLVSNKKNWQNVNRVDLYNINPNQTFSSKYINSVTLTKKVRKQYAMGGTNGKSDRSHRSRCINVIYSSRQGTLKS